MDSDVVAQIDARLAGIAHEHGVRIPLAIESGSRAWGFESADSDYDCRFIYVRRAQDYLSLWTRRDVIETPLDKTFDVNGWDLAKALRLLLKGNAVVIEWLTSPITYQTDKQFRDEFLFLARRVAERVLVARHYLHLGERQRHTYFKEDKEITQKKIFYALRPAASLRWLRLHPGEAVAPMNLQALMSESDMPRDVFAIATELVARKAKTRELGKAPLPSPIGAFIDAEFELARAFLEKENRIAPSAAAREQCDAFFLAQVRSVP
jgi:predicted nucleotidyltransferase